MKYAKLFDGCPQFAPNPVLSGVNWYGNAPAELYLALGYKPVTELPFPQQALSDGFRWEAFWSESENAITRDWIIVEIPPDEELDDSEALNILLGGTD